MGPAHESNKILKMWPGGGGEHNVQVYSANTRVQNGIYNCMLAVG